MREILFRAKTLSHGWKTGFIGYTKDPLATQIFWTEYDGIEPVTKKDYVFQETIGQFTGLTDKNGVKIFEGDIVREHRLCDFQTVFSDYVVGFERQMFIAKNKKSGSVVSFCTITVQSELEIIGNTHEEEKDE